MRIDSKEHLKNPWKSHMLMTDFEIEDVWQLPITLKPEHTIADVQEQFSKAMAKIESKGIAGWLFQFRLFLGRLFHWDEKEKQTLLLPGSIRERYAMAASLSNEQLPDPGDGNFVPVYNLTEESLAEIENTTVHTAIHLGKVATELDEYTVQMTIYVKPKVTFGQVYMWLIKPFRLLIVYPTLLRTIKRQWQSYLSTSD